MALARKGEREREGEGEGSSMGALAGRAVVVVDSGVVVVDLLPVHGQRRE